MPNALSSIVFCYRSEEKAQDGNVARWPVAIGQARNAIVTAHDMILSLDNSVSKTAQSATNALAKMTENKKVIQYGGKALKFLGDYTNQLIVASAVYDVWKADDKESAAIKNGVALSSMFLAEGLMKKHFGEKKLFEIVSDAFKGTSKAKLIAATHGVHGLAFAAVSVASYFAGSKFGDLLIGKKGEDKAKCPCTNPQLPPQTV